MSDQQPNKPAQAQEQTRTEAPNMQNTLLEQIIARTVDAVQARATRPSPFELKTFEDIENFCERVTKSKLCPKDYVQRPDDAIIAILKGKELGLPPMASLESIAVINGRPSLWGEAVPGLCIQTGQVVDVVERFEGTPKSPEFTAVCIVTRKGWSPREGRFSVEDVATARLGSVHTQYPKDMLMWRARHRAWHGAFPDVLKGLGTREIEDEIANQPEWEMPRPERAWAIPKPKKRGDGWDDAWFDDTARALFDEQQNAWAWMNLLIARLAEAPSQRDVDEIEQLDQVVATVQRAPEEAKAKIDQAFADARARLIPRTEPKADAKSEPEKPAKPAKAAKAAKTETPVKPREEPKQEEQPPAAEEPTGTGFEYLVLDAVGEPTDGVFHDNAVAWVRAYIEAAHSIPSLAMAEHNADAIADARAASPEAAKLLDELEAKEEVPWAPVVIEPVLTRGKADWPQYLRDLTAALASETAQSLSAFVEAQRARAEKFPQSVRLQATKAVIERAQALSVTIPPGFTANTPAAPAANSNGATNGASTTTTTTAPTVDKDQQIATDILTHLDTLTDANDVRLYSNNATVMTPLGRWEREGRTELATTIRSAFSGRLEQIEKERGATA